MTHRILLILEYLWKYTDEDHPASIVDIQNHLESMDIPAYRRTISNDMVELQNAGFDVICTKSSKNYYFIGERVFELPELKLLIDAVQSSRFITAAKCSSLTKKLATFSSVHQTDVLKRNLYMNSTVKTSNKDVYRIIDLLYTAINENKQVRFQYYEYTSQKKKVFKHNGQIYEFSPYALVWNNDAYYVLGHSASHGKVIKFRIDRMGMPTLTDIPSVAEPKDFKVSEYMKKVFQMYDAGTQTVELLCKNTLMKAIVDRFGEDVETHIADDAHFIATAPVSVSPTFYSWVFTYAGAMRIISPDTVKQEYREMAGRVISDCQ